MNEETRTITPLLVAKRTIITLVAGFIVVPFIFGFRYLAADQSITFTWMIQFLLLDLLALTILPIAKIIADSIGDPLRFRPILARSIRFSTILAILSWIAVAPLFFALIFAWPQFLWLTLILQITSFFTLSHLMTDGLASEKYTLSAFSGTILALPLAGSSIAILYFIREPLALLLFAGPTVFFLFSFLSGFAEIIFASLRENLGLDIAHDE